MDLDTILSEFAETPASAAEKPQAEPSEVEAKDAEADPDAEQADGEAEAEKTEQEEKPEEQKDRTERRIERRVEKKHAELMREREMRLELEARVKELTPKQQQQTNLPDVGRQIDELVQHKTVTAQCDQIFEAGTKAYKDFVPMLQEVGAEVELFQDHPFLTTQDSRGRVVPAPMPTEAMRAILETDSPVKTLRYLGQHPEDAALLAGKSGIALGKAMARLEDKMGSQKTSVSSAPKPIRSPSGSGSGKGATTADSIDAISLLKVAKGG